MSQDFTSQELSAGGGGSNLNTAGGFATGTTCPSSGTYRAENKYMQAVQIYAAGEVFRPFLDGKKTTWYALSSTTSTSGGSSDGSFTSVKVEAGTV